MAVTLTRRDFLTAAGAVLAVGAIGPGVRAAAAATVHTYTASVGGFLVNSFLLETARGVLLIDAQMIPVEATQVRDRITALGKPLLGIMISHPHLDHYNGCNSHISEFLTL